MNIIVLKKILLVLIFLFPMNSIQADIEKIEFNLKYIDNMGKGPVGSNNLSQNRDYLIAEIGYKF